MLSTFETAGAHALAAQIPVRYAVRQVLDQELQKTIALRETAARQARFRAGMGAGEIKMLDHGSLLHDDKENAARGGKTPFIVPTIVKKDFFGRVILEKPLHEIDGNGGGQKGKAAEKAGGKVWVTFHEGLNNAVRKPVTLEDFLRGL